MRVGSKLPSTSNLTTGTRPTSKLTTQFSLLSNLTTRKLPISPSLPVDLFTYMSEVVTMLVHHFSPKPANALISGLSRLSPRHQYNRLNVARLLWIDVWMLHIRSGCMRKFIQG